MSMVKSGISEFAIDIGRQPSARIIEKAVRARATVELKAKVNTGTETITARLVDARAGSLFISVTNAVDETLLRTAYCDVGLMFDGQQYLFSTNVLDVSSGAEGQRFEIARPKMLQAVQRRRFARANLAQSSQVHLGAPGDFDNHRFDGELLNVSHDGLACRISRDDADTITIDEVIGASFIIGMLEAPFALNALVKSKTPGGTQGCVILGLQFERTAAWEREAPRLNGALEHCA